jgi:superfamily II DNA/RNA helicase
VCPDGFVYNLEVEGLNTYTANGIVVHNCHHTNASTYLEVIRKLQTANPDLRILGVTATPRRTDGDGLRKVFTKNSFKLTIKDAIRLKALCPFTALAVELPPVTVRETASEDGWDQEEMGNALDYANVHAIVYQTWKEQAADRQTMIFTAGVQQAHHLAEYFRDQGVLAEAVDGTTPKEQRARIRDNYLAGAVKVLVNCAVYTEGFDAPSTSCIAMVKPTKSDVVYIQAVGRGLRQAIGKSDCLILDFCPVGLHDMRLAGDLLGKPKKEKKAEEKAKEKGVILSAFAVDDEGNGIDGDVNEVKLRVLDMLGRHSLQWTLDKGVATTVISTEVSLAIVMPQDKRIAKATELRGKPGWTPAMEKVYQDIQKYQLYWVGKDHEVRSLGNFDDPDMARAAADDFAEDHRQNAVANKRGKWRKLEPSPAQVKFARALGVYHDGMTRGACCQAIAQETIMRQFRALKIVR